MAVQGLMSSMAPYRSNELYGTVQGQMAPYRVKWHRTGLMVPHRPNGTAQGLVCTQGGTPSA